MFQPRVRWRRSETDQPASQRRAGRATKARDIMKTEKNIALRNGTVIPAGSAVTFLRREPWLCQVEHNGQSYTLRVVDVFEVPDQDTLSEWTFDGPAMSVAGNPVDQDGWDQEGSPSWLLALGFI